MGRKKQLYPVSLKDTSATVQLEFYHPSAASVCVAGSFNDWRGVVTPMVPMGGGFWRKGLTLPPGTFEYCLVVDGQWMPDPSAPESVPNPYGGRNSVLKVPLRPVDDLIPSGDQ